MGRRLKQARCESGFSQTQLANLIGVKPAEISQYESGKRTPRWQILSKILDELNISSDYLLGREINVISDDGKYKVRMSNIDIKLLKEIKKSRKLYNKLVEDPQMNVQILSSKIKKVFPKCLEQYLN